jgi:hypothetical protein
MREDQRLFPRRFGSDQVTQHTAVAAKLADLGKQIDDMILALRRWRDACNDPRSYGLGGKIEFARGKHTADAGLPADHV